MKRIYLGLTRESYQNSVYPLEGSMTIGRGYENDITLVDWEVSRSHARIIFQRGSWVIEDLGSANGIIFTGERVVKRVLRSGDVFQIGGATLRFLEEDALDDTERLSETLQVFAALIDYQSPLVDPNLTNPEFMRLQRALLSNPVFRFLGKRELRGLEDITNLHLYSAGQFIVREGDPGRSIYIILVGKVQVLTKDNKGNQFPLATLVRNEFFGEMAFIRGKPRSGSVVTLEESLLGEISYNNMRRLILRYPQIGEVLLEYSRERSADSKKKRAEANIQERRSEPRLNERLMVRFTVWPLESLPEVMINHTYKATSSDISLSGMLLVVMGPAMDRFRPACQLQLEVELPSPLGKIFTLATIRHVDQGEYTAQLGIEFLEVSAENAKKLRNFLYGQTPTIQ